MTEDQRQKLQDLIVAVNAPTVTHAEWLALVREAGPLVDASGVPEFFAPFLRTGAGHGWELPPSVR